MSNLLKELRKYSNEKSAKSSSYFRLMVHGWWRRAAGEETYADPALESASSVTEDGSVRMLCYVEGNSIDDLLRKTKTSALVQQRAVHRRTRVSSKT
ncbi:hypothetical protein J6590_099517 [Homalodisca vitripennis]|nr:hypothetical protein J6590_099517 [Homalodisca vitripennis]